jgi:hypothetical protein
LLPKNLAGNFALLEQMIDALLFLASDAHEPPLSRNCSSVTVEASSLVQPLRSFAYIVTINCHTDRSALTKKCQNSCFE